MNRLDALGDPGLRAALSFVRSRRDPPSAGELAAELELARSVARWRLERLVEAGLLMPVFARPSRRTGPGAGRPAKTYAVAPETTALEFPRRRYEALLRLLIDALPRRGRSARLADVGVAFGRELARVAKLRPAARPEPALERICRALGSLGFQATVESLSPDRAVIATPTCPLRPLVVEEHAARAVDQGMWRGLVVAALRGANAADVRCETHECLAGDSACRVLISLPPAVGDGRGGTAATVTPK
jgi:predicted ArsR family transcriptional regulator